MPEPTVESDQALEEQAENDSAMDRLPESGKPSWTKDDGTYQAAYEKAEAKKSGSG